MSELSCIPTLALVNNFIDSIWNIVDYNEWEKAFNLRENAQFKHLMNCDMKKGSKNFEYYRTGFRLLYSSDKTWANLYRTNADNFPCFDSPRVTALIGGGNYKKNENGDVIIDGFGWILDKGKYYIGLWENGVFSYGLIIDNNPHMQCMLRGVFTPSEILISGSKRNIYAEWKFVPVQDGYPQRNITEIYKYDGKSRYLYAKGKNLTLGVADSRTTFTGVVAYFFQGRLVRVGWHELGKWVGGLAKHEVCECSSNAYITNVSQIPSRIDEMRAESKFIFDGTIPVDIPAEIPVHDISNGFVYNGCLSCGLRPIKFTKGKLRDVIKTTIGGVTIYLNVSGTNIYGYSQTGTPFFYSCDDATCVTKPFIEEWIKTNTGLSTQNGDASKIITSEISMVIDISKKIYDMA